MTSTAKANDEWDHWINLLAAKWEEYLILLAKEIIIENVRYKARVDDKLLAEGIARIGKDAKALDPDPARRGNEFVVKWPGRFTITAYPKKGYIQWIPKGTQVDAVLAFLTFLCGGELMPKRFEREFALIDPPITRLGYSRKEALQVLANMELVWVGIEQFIFSDPFEQLPIGAEVSQEHPPLKHLPEGKATIRINGSHDQNGSRTTKEIEYSGNALETELLHAANHQGGEFVDFVRQYIDHVMGIEDQISALEMESRNSSAQIQLTVNDETARVEQLQDAEQRFNNDLTHITTKVLPELGRKLDDLLKRQPQPGQPAQVV